MLIRSELDIRFQFAVPTPMVAMLHLYPRLEPQVRAGNDLAIELLDQGARLPPRSIGMSSAIAALGL